MIIRYKINNLIVALLVSAFWVQPVSGQLKAKPVVTDELWAGQPVHINGHLEMKLDAAYQNRILSQNEDRLVAFFRNRMETRMWQTEFWGKWFTPAAGINDKSRYRRE